MALPPNKLATMLHGALHGAPPRALPPLPARPVHAPPPAPASVPGTAPMLGLAGAGPAPGALPPNLDQLLAGDPGGWKPAPRETAQHYAMPVPEPNADVKANALLAMLTAYKQTVAVQFAKMQAQIDDLQSQVNDLQAFNGSGNSTKADRQTPLPPSAQKTPALPPNPKSDVDPVAAALGVGIPKNFAQPKNYAGNV